MEKVAEEQDKLPKIDILKEKSFLGKIKSFSHIFMAFFDEIKNAAEIS